MNMNADSLDCPPFPPMNWDDCDWWDGEVDLVLGPAGLTVTPYDPDVSRAPSEAQKAAFAFQLANGERVIASVLSALRPYYQEMRPKYRDFLGRKFSSLMPDIKNDEDLKTLIDIRQVHVHPWTKDGIAYVGLQFGSTWDVEHGLGVMMHQDRVVDIGEADVAFAWAPDEADSQD